NVVPTFGAQRSKTRRFSLFQLRNCGSWARRRHLLSVRLVEGPSWTSPCSTSWTNQPATIFLVDLLHPGGLACPGCGRPRSYAVHRCHRAPVLDYRCGHCGRVFNAWTGTALQGTQKTPAQLVLLRGITQGTPTAQLARELGCDRKHLL